MQDLWTPSQGVRGLAGGFLEEAGGVPQAAQGMKGTGMGGCGSSDTRLPPLTSLQLPSTPIRSLRSPAVKLLWPGQSC